MAHFAEIKSSDNLVLRVNVKKDSDVESNGGEYTTEVEQWVANNTPQCPIIKAEQGGTYPETFWKQCSYNTRLGVHTLDGTPKRFNYPSPGSYWKNDVEGFTTIKHFDSWVLDNSTLEYKAPVDRPTDEQRKQNPSDENTWYEITSWDEENQYWTGTGTDGNNYSWNGTTWTQIV
jgi:hypothetical protein